MSMRLGMGNALSYDAAPLIVSMVTQIVTSSLTTSIFGLIVGVDIVKEHIELAVCWLR